jgi:hypothetical protein
MNSDYRWAQFSHQRDESRNQADGCVSDSFHTQAGRVDEGNQSAERDRRLCNQ